MKKAFLASLLILTQAAGLMMAAPPAPSRDDDEKDDNQAPPAAQASAPVKQGMVAVSTAGALSAPINEPYFPQPAYIRRRFETPSTKVEVQAPVRLPDFVAGGKLELSLKNYLDLVFANNYDISVQKLTVQLNRNAITRAYSIFDPVAFASFSSQRAQTPTSDALAGAATLNQLTQPLRLNYTQTLSTGGNYQVGFTNNKLSTNSSFQLFNPAYNSNLVFSANQPLFRGRGAAITRLPITIAQSRLKGQQFNLEDQIIGLISQAELAYWNVVEARENVRVQEQTLKLADTSLKRSQRELELGAISSLEIFQPQANYANAEIQVTQARYRLAQAEDALRRQIGADLDPELRTMPIVLTESVDPPAGALNFDRESMVSKSLQRRPDLKALAQNLDIDDLNIRGAINGLRPDLSLGLSYATFGRGGNNFIRQGNTVNVIPGGIGDALGQLFGFGFPTYSFSLTLRLPIRDRRAAADMADSLVNKKLDAMRVKSLEQRVRLEVLNAINQVENSKASVELAKIARDLAQKRVDADLKRYELGTTTIFFVLASQNDLSLAEAALVRESLQYRRNLLTLLQRTGELLQERNIVVQ
jgi:outer membrane protein